ncbi:MAG: hypothetical protein O2807_06105, partial [bacterium]|nr:hypothetical protein [bacterium]
AEEMAEACRAAAAEARLAFGDDRIYLEKRLDAPRHIEAQLLGDGKGGVLHLGERECSLQRRHQKVIEESPATGLAPEVRARLLEAACALFSKLEYRGAGTAEFLLDGAGNFYFLEINARLQVEHPVTEMVTGLDLVQLQLRIAAGERLPLAQADVRLRGHAAEARLYAEDPARDFLPQSGRVRSWLPPAGAGVRVDAGIAAGCDVPPEYDPLLAKIICHGADRTEALGRLSGALADLKATGVRTNQDFLSAVLAHPAFRAGGIATDFIARHPEVLAPPFPAALLPHAKLAAALALHLETAVRPRPDRDEAEMDDGPDPWDAPGRWLPGGMA